MTVPATGEISILSLKTEWPHLNHNELYSWCVNVLGYTPSLAGTSVSLSQFRGLTYSPGGGGSPAVTVGPITHVASPGFGTSTTSSIAVPNRGTQNYTIVAYDLNTNTAGYVGLSPDTAYNSFASAEITGVAIGRSSFTFNAGLNLWTYPLEFGINLSANTITLSYSAI